MLVTTTIKDGLAWVRFGTGERGNAMTPPLRKALRDALWQIGEDAAVRAVVLEGAGEHFCGGADLHRHHKALKEDPSSITGSTPTYLGR